MTIGLQIAPDSTAGLEEIWVLAVPESDTGARVDLTRLASPEMTRAFAGASDEMTLWLEGRMIDPAEAAMRGFSIETGSPDDDPSGGATETRDEVIPI